MELFFDIKTVFTLNWIVTYNCSNSLKWKCFWQLNCVLMLNWAVFNRTDYLHEKWIWRKITYKCWYAIKPNKATQTNSIKHQSFIYTEINDRTALFLTRQLSIRHLFAHSLNIKQFNLTRSLDPIRCYHSEPEWSWEQWQWRELNISQSSNIINTSPSDCLVPYQRRLLLGVLLACRDAVSVFYCPSRQRKVREESRQTLRAFSGEN